MTRLKKTALLSVLLTAALCAQDIPKDVIDTGDKVTKELLKKLGSSLKHELKTNGLIAAAQFCNGSDGKR